MINNADAEDDSPEVLAPKNKKQKITNPINHDLQNHIKNDDADNDYSSENEEKIYTKKRKT